MIMIELYQSALALDNRLNCAARISYSNIHNTVCLSSFAYCLFRLYHSHLSTLWTCVWAILRFNIRYEHFLWHWTAILKTTEKVNSERSSNAQNFKSTVMNIFNYGLLLLFYSQCRFFMFKRTHHVVYYWFNLLLFRTKAVRI
jgi:hypothetical protein